MVKGVRIYTVTIVFSLFWLAVFYGDAVADELSDMLKGIDVGYGKLDLGAKLRYRYECFDNYNIQK